MAEAEDSRVKRITSEDDQRWHNEGGENIPDKGNAWLKGRGLTVSWGQGVDCMFEAGYGERRAKTTSWRALHIRLRR